jgi:hypothetical protein
LARKEDELNRRFDNQFEHQRKTNGQPMNDKRNGRAWFNKKDKLDQAIGKQMEEIEKSKAYIKRLEERVAFLEKWEKELPAPLLEATLAGRLNQWKRHPRMFFVEGVEKARIVWNSDTKTIGATYVKQIPSKEQYAIFRDTFNGLRKELGLSNPTPDAAPSVKPAKAPAKEASPAKAEPKQPEGKVAKDAPKPVEPTPSPVAKRMFTEEKVKAVGGEYLPTRKIGNIHTGEIEVSIITSKGGQRSLSTYKTKAIVDTGASGISVPSEVIKQRSSRKITNRGKGSTHDKDTVGEYGRIKLEEVKLFGKDTPVNIKKGSTTAGNYWIVGMDAFIGKDLLLTPEGIAVAPKGKLPVEGMKKLETANPYGEKSLLPVVKIDGELYLIDSGAASSTLPDRYFQGNTNKRQARFGSAAGAYEATVYDKTNFTIGDIALSGLSAKKKTSNLPFYILGQDALDQLDVLIRDKPNAIKEVYIADARPRQLAEALTKVEAGAKTGVTDADIAYPPSPRQAKIDAQVERYTKAVATGDVVEQGGAARLLGVELGQAIDKDKMSKAEFVQLTKKLPKQVFDDIAKRQGCGG